MNVRLKGGSIGATDSFCHLEQLWYVLSIYYFVTILFLFCLCFIQSSHLFFFCVTIFVMQTAVTQLHNHFIVFLRQAWHVSERECIFQTYLYLILFHRVSSWECRPTHELHLPITRNTQRTF